MRLEKAKDRPLRPEERPLRSHDRPLWLLDVRYGPKIARFDLEILPFCPEFFVSAKYYSTIVENFLRHKNN